MRKKITNVWFYMTACLSVAGFITPALSALCSTSAVILQKISLCVLQRVVARAQSYQSATVQISNKTVRADEYGENFLRADYVSVWLQTPIQILKLDYKFTEPRLFVRQF